MMMTAIAVTILLLQAPPAAADDDGDWGIEAYLKASAAQPAPAATPAGAPVVIPPAPSAAPLRLKADDSWGPASAVDENDAARFSPAKPAPVSNCKTDGGTTVCGGDARSQEAVKAALKDLAKPD